MPLERISLVRVPIRLATIAVALAACCAPAPNVSAEDGDGIGSAATASIVPALSRFVSVEGRPEAVAADGSAVPVVPGPFSIDGATITTGPEDRVAITLTADPNVPSERADWLVLGPDTEVRVGTASGQADAAGLHLELRRGTVRAVVGDPTKPHLASFAIGPHALRLHDNADALLSYTPDDESGACAVQQGRAVIAAGERRITVKKGMQRQIAGAKVRAAKRMESARWSELTASTNMASIELPEVAAPVRSAARTTPAATRSVPTSRNTPAVAHDHDGDGVPDHGPEVDDGPANPPAAEPVYLRMKTTLGTIVLELDRGRAPITVANFLSYVEKEHYDGTIFHRVIGNFMIQGGGFTPDMKQKATDPPIRNEWQNGLKNFRGSIAMARTSVPDSATSQFYINVVDNGSLDTPRGGAAYCVFGRVVAGMETVDAIRAVPTRPIGGHQTVPADTVLIESIRVVTRDEALQ